MSPTNSAECNINGVKRQNRCYRRKTISDTPLINLPLHFNFKFYLLHFVIYVSSLLLFDVNTMRYLRFVFAKIFELQSSFCRLHGRRKVKIICFFTPDRQRQNNRIEYYQKHNHSISYSVYEVLFFISRFS